MSRDYSRGLNERLARRFEAVAAEFGLTPVVVPDPPDLAPRYEIRQRNGFSFHVAIRTRPAKATIGVQDAWHAPLSQVMRDIRDGENGRPVLYMVFFEADRSHGCLWVNAATMKPIEIVCDPKKRDPEATKEAEWRWPGVRIVERAPNAAYASGMSYAVMDRSRLMKYGSQIRDELRIAAA